VQVLSHFFVVHTNGAIVGLQRLAEGAAVLTYAIRADVTARDRQTIELGFALVCQELRRHCGAAWVPVAVQLAHAAPRRLASHRRCFGRNLSFAQERNAVWLDRACLQTPIGGHSHAEYVSQMRSLVPRVDRAQTVVADVELANCALMPVADCNREQVARMTGQSPRTMQRRLAAVGSTFHRLRDRVRADIAMKYLVQSTLPASQIAELPAMPTQRPSRGPSSASTACHQARCGGARADVAGGVYVAVFKSHALSANEFRNLRSGCLSGGFVAAMLGKEVLL
jgi:AraC-like DNA-binding protein